MRDTFLKHHGSEGMYAIPIVEIPGCGLGYKYDNPCSDPYGCEARQTVPLHFSSLPTYEAAAEFYSYIAYPDPLEKTEREKYRLALSRWAVLEVGKYDKTWNTTEQTIRPVIFSQSQELYLNAYKRGSINLWRRAQIAFMMLLPHLVDRLFGDGRSKRRYSVGNIAFTAATQTFGYSTESRKTVESRIWRPTKPVSHAAAAFFLCLGAITDPEQEWDDAHKLCVQQPFLATLFYEDVFRDLLLFPSEYLRYQVPSCERFRIGTKETIRFVID